YAPLPYPDIDRSTARHSTQHRAGMAKLNAAVHAARRLFLKFFVAHVFMELEPVADALVCLAVHGQFLEIFNESSRFSQGWSGLAGRQRNIWANVFAGLPSCEGFGPEWAEEKMLAGSAAADAGHVLRVGVGRRDDRFVAV